MKEFLGHETIWRPFEVFGLTNQFFEIDGSTVIYTWITILLILLLSLISRILLLNSNSVGEYIVKKIGKSFTTLVEESFGKVIDKYYYFIGSVFLYILISNWIAFIPYLEEPTKNINTTLALGISSFFYTQKEIIKIHGFIYYLKEFFVPFEGYFPLNLIAGIIILPIKLLGELSSIISLSFRLFGNIFGGAIIVSLYQQAISGSVIYSILGMGFGFLLTGFFIFFEGFLQAFVFSLLSLTNTAMAVQKDHEK